MKKPSRTVFLAWGVLLAVGVAASNGVDISEPMLMSHVRFLACEALEGRAAGEPGDRIAERYIEAMFEQAGLRPLPGLDGFAQRIDALSCTLDREQTYLAVKSGEKTTFFRIDREVFCLLKGHTDISIDAPVVFAGFGITAPEYGYDDYAGLDARGKVVLVLNHEPGERVEGEKFRGRAPTRYSSPAVKREIARGEGAVGIVIVNDAANGHPDLDITIPRRYKRELTTPHLWTESEEGEIPLFFATEPVVEALLEGTGIDIVERQRVIDRRMRPASTQIQGKRVVLNVRLASVEKKRLANIIGYIEGSDPVLKGESIVVGAHHDHLGKDDDGSIFYGADDNASGTAGLLEAARILASESDGLSRSLIFVSFCAEEQGLLGSKYFVRHLPEAAENTRAMINMDMIGRNNMDKDENENMFIVFTSAQTPALERIVRSEAGALDLDVRVAPYVRFSARSDHAVFHNRGIPIVFYFSGFHSDHNTAADTSEKILASKMEKVVSHLYLLVTVLCCDTEASLKFDRAITVEPPKDPFESPY